MFNDSALEAIKAKVSLVDLFIEDGTDPEAAGTEWAAVCPFHDDKNASLHLDEAVYHCFACDAKGNAYQYLMNRRGLSFQEAVRLMSRKAGIAIVDELSIEEEAESNADLSEFEAIAKVALDHWIKDPRGSAYLQSRGIAADNPLVPSHTVGYCDGSVVPVLTAAGFTQQQLRAQGFINDNANSVLYGRAIIPIYASGRLTNLYGRATDPNAKVKHFYLRENIAPYGIDTQQVRDAQIVHVVEAILDAAAMAQRGFAVVATYGSNGFKPAYIEQIRRRVKSLTQLAVVPDADPWKNGKPPASAISACRTITEISRCGIDCSVIRLPPGEDPCSYYTKPPAQRSIDTFAMPARSYAQEIAGGAKALCLAFEKPSGAGLKAMGRVFLQQAGSVPVQLTPDGDHAATCAADAQSCELELTISEIAADEKGIKALFHLELAGSLFHDVIATHSTAARKRVASALNLAERDATDLLLWVEEQAAHFLKLEKDEADEIERRRKQRRVLPSTQRLITELQSSPRLLEIIKEHITELGYIGEDINKVLLYIVGASAKLDDPLGCFIAADSGAGKSALIESVVALMPEEMVINISRMSPHALYYFGPDDLKHRWLIVAERVGVGESEEADYSVRTLFSEKKLTLMRPQKDESDRMVSEVKTIHGPIAYAETTTDVAIHDENATRLLEINVTESEQHTAAIHDIQRHFASIGQAELAEVVRRKRLLTEGHRGFIRSLQKVHVRIPFAEHIRFPTHLTRARRDHLKFLMVIKVIAFLHQHQRPILSSGGLNYIEATVDDYREAFTLSEPFIRRALGGIPERSFTLLQAIHNLLKGEDGLVDTTDPAASGFTYRDLKTAGIRLAPATLLKLMEPLVTFGIIEVASPGGKGRGNVSKFQLKVPSIDDIYSSQGGCPVTTPAELHAKINGATRSGRPSGASAPCSVPATPLTDDMPHMGASPDTFFADFVAGDSDPRA